MTVDVLVVGGAAMGSATAYHLKRLDPGVEVVVAERDPTYARSSTVLSDGNVRVQFNLEENIRISQYALEVIASFADDLATASHRPELSARHQGNLFLSDAAGRDAAVAGMQRQQGLGCDVTWLERTEIVERWPVFAGPGYVGGTFGPQDGSVDPSAVIQGYRRKGIEMGVEYRTAAVESIRRDGDRVVGVTLEDGEPIDAATVVLCAGAWSPGLLAAVGIDIPVLPVMRNVFVIGTDLDLDRPVPSVFLPSGLYLLPEHDGTFLIGWSSEDDPVGFDFSVQRSRFYDIVWPELVANLPAFDRLEVVRSWAGLYAVNTLDGNAILGPWPGVSGLHLCTGFSGHGFQQCHAVGRYLAELVLDQDHQLDLSRFGTERIVRKEPVREHAGRII